MAPTTIKAVELVRRIRDRHYVLLQGKSASEVAAFFHHEAAAVHADADRSRQEWLDATPETEPPPPSERAHPEAG